MPRTPMNYNRLAAVEYALKYGLNHNPEYPYYPGNDCTNFVSQCLQAGGFENYYHRTHPWFCVGNKTSICWAVAASLYWFIRVCTQEKNGGIQAETKIIQGDAQFSREIAESLKIGDIIQYINQQNRIQHSVVITGFFYKEGLKQPKVSQHTYEAVDIPWNKDFYKTIFHKIL